MLFEVLRIIIEVHPRVLKHANCLLKMEFVLDGLCGRVSVVGGIIMSI